MSKKKKTHHDNLMFAFRVYDTFSFGDSDTIYLSPWFETEQEALKAQEQYQAEKLKDKAFYKIESLRKPKEPANR